ncbi:hypothetical protein Y032_0021g321 [Ancylostoma ceylanicum]|uniref:Uncharacterized protein n=1 Tax=Ancylostoma ceylanicum TaxID=53326 RepID=A0A016V0U7_9BILA|nr:hypothetical protein Y032_0021g321 [Ancylostoma ceylanicum]
MRVAVKAVVAYVISYFDLCIIVCSHLQCYEHITPFSCYISCLSLFFLRGTQHLVVASNGAAYIGGVRVVTLIGKDTRCPRHFEICLVM